LLAVALVFGQTVSHEFVNFDDDVYVYENPHVAHGLTLSRIGWAFAGAHRSIWAPLTWISLMLDGQLYDLSAGGFHLSNVLLHAAATIVLFLVLWRMTGSVWPSGLAAALFAVHPLRVESVAWVTERKDVLSGLFCVLTLAAYVGYVYHPSRLWYLAVIVLFALGLMAKAILVTLPFVLLLLDYWPLGRMHDGTSERTPTGTGGRLRRMPLLLHLLVEKWPLLALAATSSMITNWTQGRAMVPLSEIPLAWRLVHTPLFCLGYLGHFAFPLGLAPAYPRPGLELPLAQGLAAFLILAAVTVAVFVGRRRYPYLLVGWLWYLVMLLPVSGPVQLGAQAVADRFTYLPQIGLYIALVWAAVDVGRGWAFRRGLWGLTSALVLAALMGCAWRQTSFWHDSFTLWNHTLACTSANNLAHNSLACAFADREQWDEAIAQYQRSLQIQPRFAPTYDGLGAALTARGQFVPAIACLRRALWIWPDAADNHYDLANVLVCTNQTELAIAHYERAVELSPEYLAPRAHEKLAEIFASQGRWEEAIGHCEQALAIDSYHAKSLGELAWLLATCPKEKLRNGSRAVDLAERAVRFSPNLKAETFDALAAANAEAGHFAEALAAAGRGLELARQQNNPRLASDVQARMAQYRAGKPFHQTSLPAYEPTK
jgi:tetratricopeptide (TPR) repeat protein